MTDTFNAAALRAQATDALAEIDAQVAEAREMKRQNAARIKHLLAERAEMARIVNAMNGPRRRKQSANGDE